MDVDAVNGEGDKDKKSQARMWMSQCLYCKGPQSVYILSSRRYLYLWDLLLLLRFLHDYKGFRLLRTLELGAIHNNHRDIHIRTLVLKPCFRILTSGAHVLV